MTTQHDVILMRGNPTERKSIAARKYSRSQETVIHSKVSVFRPSLVILNLHFTMVVSQLYGWHCIQVNISLCCPNLAPLPPRNTRYVSRKIPRFALGTNTAPPALIFCRRSCAKLWVTFLARPCSKQGLINSHRRT